MSIDYKSENYASIIGKQLLILVGFNVLLGALCILFNIELSKIIFIVSFIASMVYGSVHIKRKDKQNNKVLKILLLNIVFIFLVGISAFISMKFYDISHDGQMYHQEAIIQLQEGWNPLYDEDLDEANYQPYLWVNHYAKGTWIYGAIVYDLLGNLEYGKSLNVILLIASMLLAYGLLRKINIDKIWSFILSILIGFNPITMNQLFTFYVDGLLYSLVLILIILMVEKYILKDRSLDLYLILTLILLINVKFTALGYAIIICGLPILLNFYNALVLQKLRNIKSIISETIKIKELYSLVLGVVLGVVVVGASSYVINTIDHKHPFYPLAGEDSVDIMIGNTPEVFENASKLEQIYLSIFSESQNTINEELKSKFPLKVTNEELEIIWLMDVRVGGFGPLFGAAFITFLIGLLLWKDIFREKFAQLGAIAASVIIITVIINPEIWWARYIPQLWMLPIIFMAILCIGKISKYKKIFLVILSLILFVNVAIMLKINLEKTAGINKDLKIQLETMHEYSQNHEIIAQFGSFESNRARFEYYEINYTKVDNLSCENPLFVPFSLVKFCVDNPDLYNEIYSRNYQNYQ